ncbi:MAG: hypothetical protein WDO56_36570 [Gammaproteobacteria bacterium]
MTHTLQALAETAARVIGKDDEQTAYVSAAAERFLQVGEERDANRNYRGVPDARVSNAPEDKTKQDRASLQKIVQETDPTDETAVSRAVDLLDEMRHSFELKGELLRALREKVKFPDRAKYVQIIARIDELNSYAKLGELKACKAKWSSSSAALDDVFKGIGIPLVQIHADELVSHDYFLGFEAERNIRSQRRFDDNAHIGADRHIRRSGLPSLRIRLARHRDIRMREDGPRRRTGRAQASAQQQRCEAVFLGSRWRMEGRPLSPRRGGRDGSWAHMASAWLRRWQPSAGGRRTASGVSPLSENGTSLTRSLPDFRQARHILSKRPS